MQKGLTMENNVPQKLPMFTRSRVHWRSAFINFKRAFWIWKNFAHQVLASLQRQQDKNVVCLNNCIPRFSIHVEWNSINHSTVQVNLSRRSHLRNYFLTCFQQMPTYAPSGKWSYQILNLNTSPSSIYSSNKNEIIFINFPMHIYVKSSNRKRHWEGDVYSQKMISWESR